MNQHLIPADILTWLREENSDRLAELWQAADAVRTRSVGPAVHLRGLVEISSHCVRQCGYCGLRADHRTLTRYRLSAAEILDCARQAILFGYGTVVLQAGEDYGLTAEFISAVVRQIKAETPLAVTLSLGERRDEELAAWRAAGADRYLLRFETSDPELYRLIHPALPGRVSDRVELLRRLRTLGYEIGSGIMVGIPGQTYENVAADLELFRTLDLDMIGIGPFIAHPATPLGSGAPPRAVPADAQVPHTELMVYKAVALTRLLCPQANIPSTTALATINKDHGRELGLQRGANVVMPNLTPKQYRQLYEIYPAKACVEETARACHLCLRGRIASIHRTVGAGPGGRKREPVNLSRENQP